MGKSDKSYKKTFLHKTIVFLKVLITLLIIIGILAFGGRMFSR